MQKHICQSVWDFKSVITDITRLYECLGPLFLGRKWIVKYLEMPIDGLKSLKKILQAFNKIHFISLKWKREFLTSDCFAYMVTLLNSEDSI